MATICYLILGHCQINVVDLLEIEATSFISQPVKEEILTPDNFGLSISISISRRSSEEERKVLKSILEIGNLILPDSPFIKTLGREKERFDK